MVIRRVTTTLFVRYDVARRRTTSAPIGELNESILSVRRPAVAKFKRPFDR